MQAHRKRAQGAHSHVEREHAFIMKIQAGAGVLHCAAAEVSPRTKWNSGAVSAEEYQKGTAEFMYAFMLSHSAKRWARVCLSQCLFSAGLIDLANPGSLVSR